MFLYLYLPSEFLIFWIACLVMLYSLALPLGITNFFTVSVVLPFPTCLSVGIVEFIAFSDWLLSLSSRHLSFLHVFSCLDGSFLPGTKKYFIVWMYHSLYILLLKDILVVSKICKCKYSCYINIPVEDFVWTSYFQVLWVYTKECDCWIRW